ncbi:hypothetical protein [Curtobacterium sp. B8]|uniref:hypothetical protein n=1 Tax=Curtobacterium sp. B8 TaxID=95611 RepID=UPI000349FF06|nr:hypothetical protein [Curtobacterium sp. B8]
MNGGRIVVVNTLGGALRHYAAALVASFGSDDVRLLAVDEPSVAGGSGLAWLGRTLRALVRARRLGGRVVVTWPVLGHLDRVLLRLVLGAKVDAALVVHDPRPLVHARGYGAGARWLGRFLGGSVRMIVHSEQAADALREHCPGDEPVLLPHPVAPRSESSRRPPASARPVVRVLGQYKPDRDVALLVALAARLGDTHLLEVVGRGWPPVAGWSVRDAFVGEAELDDLIVTADAVLVPYRRFFQSGVAIRSLELGTPAVGPADSSMADLYPDDRFLADGSVDSWCRAVERAAGASRSDTVALARAADERARGAWRTEYAVP